MLRWAAKDPDEIDNRWIEWSGRIDADTIQSATWTVPAGITKTAQSESGSRSTIIFSGGTHGTDYDVQCRIVTTGGLTLDETVRLPVRTR